MGVGTTRHWRTSGRLATELDVGTVVLLKLGLFSLSVVCSLKRRNTRQTCHNTFQHSKFHKGFHPYAAGA